MDLFSELTNNEVENTPEERPITAMKGQVLAEGEATTPKANFPSPDSIRKWKLVPVPPNLDPFEPRIICRFPAPKEPMFIPKK